MRVAYQGEPGAYSEAAALAFDPGAVPVPCRSFEDVFRAVAGGDAARGMVGLGRLSVPENQPEMLRLFDGIKVEQKQQSVQLNVKTKRSGPSPWKNWLRRWRPSSSAWVGCLSISSATTPRRRTII